MQVDDVQQAAARKLDGGLQQWAVPFDGNGTLGAGHRCNRSIQRRSDKMMMNATVSGNWPPTESHEITDVRKLAVTGFAGRSVKAIVRGSGQHGLKGRKLPFARNFLCIH